jgi:hypothetical protein
VATVLVVGGLWACGDDDGPSGTTTTTDRATTTTTTTTTEATAPTVDSVVAWIQGELDAEFAESDPQPPVTGPSKIICADTGPVAVGGVLVCTVAPTTEPGQPLESGSAVIYVLAASGRSAFAVATDNPGSTEALAASYAQTPKGLLCRDLLDPDVATHPFQAAGTTPETGYLWSLVYWSLEGEPERMDEDQDGIPCETRFEPEVVAGVLDGGRVS